MRRGFSLGELLIVLGIVGLIAALLFPVFAKARESAYQTSAISNLAEVGLAESLYAADSDEVWALYFAGYIQGTGRYADQQAYWPQLVAPYIESLGKTHGRNGQAIDTDLPKVFFDPIVRFVPQAEGDYGYIASWGVSDAIVDWVGPEGWRPSRVPAASSQIAHPSDTYLNVETRDYMRGGIFPGNTLALAPQTYYYGANATASTAGHFFGSDDFHHLPATGRTLVLFCDGHAKSDLAARVATRRYGWFRTSPDLWP